MSEERKKDNTVKIDLNMDQMQGAEPLSNANLSINYPQIDRNMGNIINYDTALAVLLQSIEWHMQRTSLLAPEDLGVMSWWLNNIASKFTALGDKYSQSEAARLVEAAKPASTPAK